MQRLLEFEIDAARYGVPVERVVEVVPRVWLKPLPGAANIVVGLFNFRGAVIVAVDPRSRLGHPPRRPSTDDHLLVVQGARRVVALVVDRVRDLRQVSPDQMFPTTVPSRHIRGVVALAEGLLLIEDLDALLSLDEEETLDRALGGAAP
ncbi:MAG: chemotaxis protein CheW [Deltaproteobacteria bacterium]|nr:chemotaxis protein CheW [Myxococcales bacterium]MDP3216226.1 chemotaxis protein CheW [Deltaproteobacteria bacterium]